MTKEKPLFYQASQYKYILEAEFKPFVIFYFKFSFHFKSRVKHILSAPWLQSKQAWLGFKQNVIVESAKAEWMTGPSLAHSEEGQAELADRLADRVN